MFELVPAVACFGLGKRFLSYVNAILLPMMLKYNNIGNCAFY